MPPKVLLVGFDGLRPDLITPEVMPNLAAFAASGVTFTNHRSVFPSETRVNLTSLSTGSWPESHGIVANKYVDPGLPEFPIFDTSRADHIERGDAVYNGRLVGSTSLGEALDRAGRTIAVIATGSQGSARLKSHKTLGDPHVSISCGAPETSRPYAVARTFMKAVGEPPPGDAPASALARYATDLFLSQVFPKVRPDVTMLWYVEPDTSFHYLGLGASEATLRAVDLQFGRLLDWWQDHPDVQIIAMSDHGHVVQEWSMDVPSALGGLGLRTAARFQDDADIIVLPGHVTRIWLRREKRALAPLVAHALMQAPWCGPIFAKQSEFADGTLPQTLVRADHPRSPDFYCVRYADSVVGRSGLRGRAYFVQGDGLPDGAGNHGGLQREEITSFAAMGGSRFRTRCRSVLPSGIVDIAPTILHLLGVPKPSSMTGRPLHEGLGDHDIATGEIEREEFSANFNGYRQVLHRMRVNGKVYLDHAERTEIDPPLPMQPSGQGNGERPRSGP